MKKLFLIVLFFTAYGYAQNASDYFPSVQGFKWYFKTTPYDSLNNQVDSLSFYLIDSFAVDMEYEGRLSHLVLSKYGVPQSIIQSPYTDSSFVHIENSDIWNYIKEIGGISIALPFDYEGWYSVYRLGSPTSATYTIFSKDTLLTIGSTSLTLRFEVTGRRLADQLVTTAYGDLLCKKFLLRPAVKYIPPIPIPITLISVNDTVWLAPGHYIVKNLQPSANADLSLFGIPPFYVPGSLTEAIPVPPILNMEPGIFNIRKEGDTVLVIINNQGEGVLNWTAEVIAGTRWISILNESSGGNNDSLYIAAAPNDTNAVRSGIIQVNAEGSFSAPQFIYLNQEEGVLVSSEEEAGVPLAYHLEQNYPNPFNSSTLIGFTLKSYGYVKIVLYDMLGNVLDVIAEGNFPAGRHSLKLNADQLSSGVYIYRMTSGGFTASEKMVILK